MAAERRLPLETTINTRDLGGYRTEDGRTVCWGKIFRSDALSRLSPVDLAYLAEIPLSTVVDLRSPQETQDAPDRLPDHPAPRYFHLPVETADLNSVSGMERLRGGDDSWFSSDFMVRAYIRVVEDCAHVLGQALTLMADEKNLPLLFHCTGGKDRAGTCAAILLLALGVPKADVLRDHQLSNHFIDPLWRRKIEPYLSSLGVDPLKVRPYFFAPLEAVEALFDHLDRHYGSVPDYLTTKAGLTQ